MIGISHPLGSTVYCSNVTYLFISFLFPKSPPRLYIQELCLMMQYNLFESRLSNDSMKDLVSIYVCSKVTVDEGDPLLLAKD